MQMQNKQRISLPDLPPNLHHLTIVTKLYFISITALFEYHLFLNFFEYIWIVQQIPSGICPILNLQGCKTPDFLFQHH